MSARRGRRSWWLCAIVAFCMCGFQAAPASAAVNAGPGAQGTSPGDAPAAPGIRLAQATGGQQGTDSETSSISPYLDPAPNIFEATGLAQWDGKRTLQGIWVAHPLATTARRVRIFNTTNGRAVDGALFKRDAALSGTSVLISSEAAQLLGMTPGISAELRIVAVTPAARREPVAQPAEDVAIDETSKPIAAETSTPAETEPAETKPAEVAATDAKPVEIVQPDPPAAPEVTEPEKPAVAPKEDAEPLVARAPTPKARPRAAQPEPEQSPQPTAPDDSGTFKWEPGLTEAQTTAAKAPETPPKPQPQAQTPTKPAKASPLRLPFVQAGVFGVPGNATRLVARLEKRGIPALTRKTRNGRLTRVLAGPFQTSSERSQAQRTIRRMGLSDAVPVRK